MLRHNTHHWANQGIECVFQATYRSNVWRNVLSGI